jgi:hypothetical protein
MVFVVELKSIWVIIILFKLIKVLWLINEVNDLKKTFENNELVIVGKSALHDYIKKADYHNVRITGWPYVRKASGEFYEVVPIRDNNSRVIRRDYYELGCIELIFIWKKKKNLSLDLNLTHK